MHMSKINFKKLKMYQTGLRYILIAFTGAFLLGACEDENGTDASNPGIPLSVAGAEIKAPGSGQYRINALSSDIIVVKADVSELNSLKSLIITKTNNLVTDTKFGSNGVLTVSPASINDGSYTLTYPTDTLDLDKLIGFSFRAEDQNGKVITSDLTLSVNLSPRDNLPRKRWVFNTFKVVGLPDEFIRDCEKDNSYIFKSDSTLTYKYGDQPCTGPNDCDGCEVPKKWHLTGDGKHFIISKQNVFSGAITVDSFSVEKLTAEELELVVTYPGFGSFLYGYKATLK
jgi:hypothetical protein